MQRALEVYDDVQADTDRSLLALQAVIATALLAPDFLFRVEIGVDDPRWTDRRALDEHELAARLSMAFLDAPPDDQLRALADLGGVAASVDVQARDALLEPGADTALEAFFAQWFELDGLELASKDPVLFPQWTPELVAAMRHEALALFHAIALERDDDLRTLFTSLDADLSPELVALYGAEAGLPPERAGLLSRSAFLAANAHPALTSPTHRGRFVRTRLLCQDVPPPPEGVVADLEQLDNTGTLRDMLEQHASDPACSSCHERMDPIGYTFEHFDPIGAWRDLDRGLPVDASGELDDVPVDGAASLGAALAEHPRLPACLADNVWAHLLGHLAQRAEGDQLDAVVASFAADDHRLSGLAAGIATTDAFLTVHVPEGGACERDEEGLQRPCSTACGDGVETCLGSTWSACTAARPTDERCNGLDDDCDGGVDEVVRLACEADGRPGLTSCVAGAWSGCEAVVGAETCNGLDDDGDGLTDEDLGVDLRAVAFADVTASHPACLPEQGAHHPACRAAVHRFCADSACATSGLGPVASTADASTLACLDESEAVVMTTSYTALTAQHGWCTQDNRFGSDCNAAIHRWCAAQGLTTGYGPIENSGDVAVVICNPTAELLSVNYGALSSLVSGCTWPEQRDSEACDEATHRWCRQQGFATGHGPLENFDNTALVACLGVGP